MPIERLNEKIAAIRSRIPAVRGRGEEATKQALVLPFLSALGFDVWNPDEVRPEFEADFAVKKAGQKEKVDLAVLLDGAPRIFIEVKPIDERLDGHHGQLCRYFNGVRSVSLAVLTNGDEYRFYTDTREPNLLDAEPFHVFRVDTDDPAFDVIERFNRVSFSTDAVRAYAIDLSLTNKLGAVLRDELDLKGKDPSETLVRWLLAFDGVYEGRVNIGVVDRFRPIVKSALQGVIKDIVRRSISALDDSVRTERAVESTPAVAPEATARAVVTTEQELRAFSILKEHLRTSPLAASTLYDFVQRKDIPLELGYKDTTVYFSVFFNRPSMWFVRLQLSGRQPWIGVNLSAEAASSLLPPTFSLLSASTFADVRIGIQSADDLLALRNVIQAAMQNALNDRR